MLGGSRCGRTHRYVRVQQRRNRSVAAAIGGDGGGWSTSTGGGLGTMRRLRQELERLDIRTVALADAAVGCDAAVGWSGGGSWAGGGSQAARSSVAIGSCGSGGERWVLFDSLGCCLLPCEEIALTCSLLCCSLLCILAPSPVSVYVTSAMFPSSWLPLNCSALLDVLLPTRVTTT